MFIELYYEMLERWWTSPSSRFLAQLNEYLLAEENQDILMEFIQDRAFLSAQIAGKNLEHCPSDSLLSDYASVPVTPWPVVFQKIDTHLKGDQCQKCQKRLGQIQQQEAEEQARIWEALHQLEKAGLTPDQEMELGWQEQQRERDRQNWD